MDTSSTIPTPEDARQAALARRQARQNEHDAQLLEQRSVLYGDVQLKIEQLMETADVDDIALLQAVTDILDGKTPEPVTAPATESLSDDEQELINAFRKGRVVKTDKGAFRDKEWGVRERAPKAEPATPAVEAPEPTPVKAPEPVAPKATAPEPKIDEVSKAEPATPAVEAPEPTQIDIVKDEKNKDKTPSIKERVTSRTKLMVKNITS